uniref:hypothetical protein n=1 Tax=Candidatus Electrothrix sp. TaxID=2170559 RepID=UPI004057B008
MHQPDLLSQIALGEDSTRQFKEDVQSTDELPTKAGIDKVDKLRFRDFLRDFYEMEYPDSIEERTRLLQNMNLATDDGNLNLGGLLMFGEQPELIMPQFVVKGIRYPGNEIHASDYMDTEDLKKSMLATPILRQGSRDEKASQNPSLHGQWVKRSQPTPDQRSDLFLPKADWHPAEYAHLSPQ